MALLLLLSGCIFGKKGDDAALEGLVGVLVSPESVVVPDGGEVQLVATGLFDDRTTRDVTSVVEWASADGGVASVSNDLDDEGLLEGRGLGETEVWAIAGDATSNRVAVTVTDAGLLGLTVEPDPIQLGEGQTVQLVANAAWSDGSRGDAAAQVRWVTEDGSVAQIASGGLLTAAGEGETTIKAVWEDVESQPVPVTVLAGSVEPDLYVRAAEGVGGGGAITLSVTVANAGEGGAGGFWVDAWVDPGGEPDFGGTGDDFVLVDWVGPGDETEVQLTLYAGSGSHDVWVLVDTNEEVAESDEGNNTFSTTVSGGSGGGGDDGGPNLEVTYFDYLVDWESIYYYVDITNSGNEDVGEFYVDLFVDQSREPELYDDGDDFTSIPSLDAGDTTYADFLVDNLCGSYCQSWILIDGYDYVEETDEGDNVAGPLYVSYDYGYYYY